MNIKLFCFILFVALFLFATFSCSKEPNCENGEFIAGECVCQNGCTGDLCETCPELLTIEPEAIFSLCPQNISGDNHNEGAVQVQISTLLEIIDGSVYASISFETFEQGADETRTAGNWRVLIYTPEANQQLLSIQSDKLSNIVALDSDEAINIESTDSDSDLVQYYEFNTKGPGEDVGNCTFDNTILNIYLRPIEFLVINRG